QSFVWTSSSTKGLVYVDDIIFGSTTKSWCDEFEVLMKGEFKMSVMGELTFFLGLQVKQLPDGIFISQDNVRTATTPYEVPKPKSKDAPDDAVNCKKQTVVATSSTEAEYVAAASCCGQSTICIVKNPVFHQRTKHIEIRHHFIRDANEKNLIQSTLGCSIPRQASNAAGSTSVPGGGLGSC
nr:retrotransposon protein, putative, unclassified [Tanacetum cinerariifolium]